MFILLSNYKPHISIRFKFTTLNMTLSIGVENCSNAKIYLQIPIMELYSSLFYFMYAVVRPNKINVLFHCNSTVRANNVPTVTNFINILKKKKEEKNSFLFVLFFV